MICYAVLNGTGAYFFKRGLYDVKGIEMTIKGFFRNPFRGIYQLLKVPIFILGGVFSVGGFLIYQYALSTYDVSIVKPLTNLSIIIIFILGYQLLKERLTKRELLGIAAMISGLILLSMFITEKSTLLDLAKMIIFSIILIIICLTLISITLIKRNKKIDEYFLTIVSGLLFSLGIIYNNAMYLYEEFSLTLEFFLYNPFFYLLIISYFFAFFIGMVAYSVGRMTIIAPMGNLLSMGVPVLGAVFIFYEDLIILIDGAIIFPFSFFKIIGIILIIIGTLIMYPKIEPLRKLEPVQS